MQQVQTANSVIEKILEKMNELSPDKQQEVLDFVDFLSAKLQAQSEASSSESEPTDFYKERLSKYSGCVDSGHNDLSTNKEHMKDFGKV